MNNVRFLYIRPTGYGQGYESSEQIEVVFKICPKLTERLRKHAQCPPYRLCRILDENGHYYYQFPLKRDGEDRQRLLRFIRTPWNIFCQTTELTVLFRLPIHTD